MNRESPAARRKAMLPQKVCAVCGRPFSWRRKWARDWSEVRFCSDACRTRGAAAAMPHHPAARR